jgi:hypothetical protein
MVIDTPLAKDYDAFAELEVTLVGTIRVGVEFERSLKSSARYREIVEDIRREKQIDLLIFLTASFDLIFQLKSLIGDLDFPICLAQSKAFCKEPLAHPMHNTLNEEKTSLLEICGMLDKR